MSAAPWQVPPGRDLPELRAEMTVFRPPAAQSVALHRLALPLLTGGITDWIDARNAASTYALYEVAPSERVLSGLRIARAFTAYQHVDLVERALRRATARRETPRNRRAGTAREGPQTSLLVVPNVASLYRDDDVPDHERDALFDAVLDALGDLAASLELPVLVSVRETDALAERVLEAGDRTVDCERTREGYRYVADDFETTVYGDAGAWQTTIPYWVERCGVGGEAAAVRTAEAHDFPGVA